MALTMRNHQCDCVYAGEECKAARGRSEEAAQALKVAHAELDCMRAAAATADAANWEQERRLAGLQSELEAAQTASAEHQV